MPLPSSQYPTASQVGTESCGEPLIGNEQASETSRTACGTSEALRPPTRGERSCVDSVYPRACRIGRKNVARKAAGKRSKRSPVAKSYDKGARMIRVLLMLLVAAPALAEKRDIHTPATRRPNTRPRAMRSATSVRGAKRSGRASAESSRRSSVLDSGNLNEF